MLRTIDLLDRFRRAFARCRGCRTLLSRLITSLARRLSVAGSEERSLMQGRTVFLDWQGRGHHKSALHLRLSLSIVASQVAMWAVEEEVVLLLPDRYRVGGL